MVETEPSSVVFINPPGPAKLYRSIYCTYLSKANYIWQPQDFINLSAQIPSQYNLLFFDCCVERLSDEEVLHKVLEANPTLAIVSLSSIVFEHDIEFLKKFRYAFPKTRLLVLGDIFLEKVFWERGLEFSDGLILNSLDIDLAGYLERGVSESPWLVLKSEWLDKPEQCFDRIPRKNTSPKPVSIGLPRHELFINKKYRFPFVKAYRYCTVMTQFGCPFRCNYCTQYNLPVVYREFREVLAEIEYIRGLGIQDIFFGDPSFGFPKDNAVALLKEMIRRGLSMRWVCYANPGLVDDEMLGLMKAAGCHTIIIGVENEDIDMLRERYQRNLTRSRLVDFCKDCHRLGIRVCGDFIIGLDGTQDSVDGMVAFAKDLKLDYASFNIFTVLFGSKVRSELVAAGKVNPYDAGSDTSGMAGAERDSLIALKNRAVRRFYFRPGYLFRRLRGITGIQEFGIQLGEMVGLLKNAMHVKRTL